MFRKVVLVLVLVFAGLSLMVIEAQDSIDVEYINPLFSADYVDVYSNQQIVLKWGWKSATAGSVRQFIRATTQEHMLDGVVVFSTEDINDGWGTVQHEDPLPICRPINRGRGKGQPPANRPTAISRWTFDLGVLAPGDYVLHSIVYLDSELEDGCDSEGDGVLDTYGPGVIRERTIYIHVTDPS